ncbi:hypothetical protein ACWEVP_31835 [Amycolatopsis sp. NPDC003865]
MTPEQIKADLAQAAAKNDEFYKMLIPVLQKWTEVAMFIAAVLPDGTTKDVSQIQGRIREGADAIHGVADASIFLGQALGILASEY